MKLIKKIPMLALLVTLMVPFIFASCGDDEDDKPVSPVPDKIESLVGRWQCDNNAYDEPFDEPLIFLFEEDGTGYEWFMDEPFSYRIEFTYLVSSTKIKIKTKTDTDGNDYVVEVEYEMSDNGRTLILYGYDDDDMSELKFHRI